MTDLAEKLRRLGWSPVGGQPVKRADACVFAPKKVIIVVDGVAHQRSSGTTTIETVRQAISLANEHGLEMRNLAC